MTGRLADRTPSKVVDEGSVKQGGEAVRGVNRVDFVRTSTGTSCRMMKWKMVK